MGGRGASSPDYKNYGSEYHSVWKFSNIKFVINTAKRSTSAPLETRTKNRVYATLNYKTGKVEYISYYDTVGKKFKTIDLGKHKHYNRINRGKGIRELKNPHRHSGYHHKEDGSGNLTTHERHLTAIILNVWRKNAKREAVSYIRQRDGNDRKG